MSCLMAAGGFAGDDEQATTTVSPYSAARLTVTVLGVWNFTSLGKSENRDQFPKPCYQAWVLLSVINLSVSTFQSKRHFNLYVAAP